MNYQKHYDALMNRAKNRLLEGYCETHHIIPRCMGGTDHLDNLVDLSAEEHYVAHQLLVKIYPENRKLAFAAQMMTVKSDSNFGRSRNKLYSWVRKKLIVAAKEQWKLNKEKGINIKGGRPYSVTQETKDKICEMYLTGMSYKRVAKSLKCGIGTVHKTLNEYNLFESLSVREGMERARKNGIKLGRPTNLTKEIIELVRKDKDFGLSIKRISKKYNIGVGTIYSILNGTYG